VTFARVDESDILSQERPAIDQIRFSKGDEWVGRKIKALLCLIPRQEERNHGGLIMEIDSTSKSTIIHQHRQIKPSEKQDNEDEQRQTGRDQKSACNGRKRDEEQSVKRKKVRNTAKEREEVTIQKERMTVKESVS
jgi:hypothetical protein